MRYTDYKFHVPEEKIVRLIVDTDAKNEADDQFAIVQALLSPKFENGGGPLWNETRRFHGTQLPGAGGYL